MFYVYQIKTSVSPCYSYFWGEDADSIEDDIYSCYEQEQIEGIVAIYAFENLEELFDSDLEESIKYDDDLLFDFGYAYWYDVKASQNDLEYICQSTYPFEQELAKTITSEDFKTEILEVLKRWCE